MATSAPEATDADRAWAHYMSCDALVKVEELAEILGCREDQVVARVRWLLGL